MEIEHEIICRVICLVRSHLFFVYKNVTGLAHAGLNVHMEVLLLLNCCGVVLLFLFFCLWNMCWMVGSSLKWSRVWGGLWIHQALNRVVALV